MQLYFLEAVTGEGAIKIGWSRNVEKRLGELECGSPLGLRVLCSVAAARHFEADLHRVLRAHRLRREWFDRSPMVLDAVAAADRGELVAWINQRRTKKLQRQNPNIDRDAPAFVVAERFGGLSALSRAIGKSTSTVQKWLLGGFIPLKYHEEIIAAGDALSPKVRIKPVDFVTRRKPVAADAETVNA